jgi:multiple sugar transport system permease protein
MSAAIKAVQRGKIMTTGVARGSADRPHQRTRRRGTRSQVLAWLRYAILGLALVVVLFPLAFLLITSFRPEREFLGGTLLPDSLTLDHYRVAFENEGVGPIFWNSLRVTSVTTVVSVAVGTLAAYSLARINLSQRIVAAIIFTFIFIRFYPRIATVVPWFLLVREVGLLDTVWAVVFGHLGITVPFVTWLMYVMFKDLPPELEESASVDGASVWKRFWHIVLPISTPGMVSAAIFTAFLSWNEYLIASSVTREEAKVLPVTVAGFVTDKGVEWGPISAISVIIVIPMILFALTVQRYLVKGLTLGAVKG